MSALGLLAPGCQSAEDELTEIHIVLHASPAGSEDANGSAARPYSLAQALDAVSAETETIILHSGIYEGPHVFEHDFMRDEKLVVRPDSAFGARIDGAFYRTGGGIRWQDVEFSVSEWIDRKTSDPGSDPSQVPDFNFSVLAKDEFINCVIRDHNNNGFWSPAEDLLVYGCLFYNQGWAAPDRGHGHAAYLQNEEGTKRFARNVFIKGFSRQTVQVYGSARASLEGFHFEENVSIGGRWLVGGEAPVERLVMSRNHIQGTMQLGYDPAATNRDARLVDNILSEPAVRLGVWTDLEETGTVYSDDLDTVYVYDNAYDPDRALVVVYNASRLEAMTVDVSSLTLTEGRHYRFVNAMNPREARGFVFDGRPVVVPMTGWTVGTPVASDSMVVGNPFPAFGVFLLMPANSTDRPGKVSGRLLDRASLSRISTARIQGPPRGFLRRDTTEHDADLAEAG